ncbi:MAG: hypothetical protein MK137_05970 [Rickettsiales bacterium]|nr:hypothetical protein [Rickettsiales bacterium]
MRKFQHNDLDSSLNHYDAFNEIEDANEDGDALAKAKILEEHLKAQEAMRNENQDVDLENIESFSSMISDEEKEVTNKAYVESEEQEDHIDQEQELDQRNLGRKSKIKRELDRIAAEKRRLKE